MTYRSSTQTLILLLVLAFALLLRTLASQDAFWLDEIWSYYLSRLVENPLDILTEIRIDNNHPLNTLFMYLMDDQSNWTVYRLPALIAGVATVALLGLGTIKLRGSALITVLLAAFSLPLIQYSAEARGYGLAAFFAVSAWYTYSFHLRPETSTGWLITFWLACSLGILSHATFLFIFLALCITEAVLCLQQQCWDQLKRSLKVFLPPGLVILWVYAYFYSRTSPGGEQASLEISPVLLQLGQLLTGAPEGLLASLAGSMLAVILALYGIKQLPAEQRWFFASVFIVPAALLVVYQPRFFYLRYLLVCMPFFYLLAALAITPALKGGQAVRAAVGALLLLMLTGNSLLIKDYLQWGKGDYPAAIELIHSMSPDDSFTVGSDFDFRNKSILDFYGRLRADNNKLVYVEEAYTSSTPTDFFITHDQQQEAGANTFLRLKNGFTYELIGIYPYSGLSGWNWYIYRYDPDSQQTP